MVLTNLITACDDDHLKANVIFNSGEDRQVINILIEALKSIKVMDEEACIELLEALRACFLLDLELELPE